MTSDAAMRRVVGLLRDSAGPAEPAAIPDGLGGLGELVGRFEASGRAVRLRLPDEEETATWPPGQLDVVRAVARGRTNQEIADELFISLSTVKSHVAGVQAKLGLRNRVEIAAWAWENRVVGGT